MRAYIVTTFLGSFALGEKNEILAFIPFPKDPAKITERLKKSEELLDEERKLIQQLSKKGYTEFIFGRKKGEEKFEPDNKAEIFIRENLREIALERKIVSSQEEFNQLLSKAQMEITKQKLRKAVGRDELVIQTTGAIEELDKSINIFAQRLREMYGLHFPELCKAVEDHLKFAKIVEKYGARENIDEPELRQLASKSIGADLSKEDMEIMQEFSSELVRMFELRKQLEKYLEKILKEVAPNFTELASPILAAKLIARAGGLEKLAKMPSSTIQLLGAEKSLFRFLHGKGKSPRFGFLFNHPLVMRVPEKLKGKVARLVSSKLSIAARLDYYSKEYKGDKLKKELEEKVEKILKS